MKVALVDYGAGNLSSVANAMRALKVEPSIVSSPDDLGDATHMVLPGVGSFGDCMGQLSSHGWVEVIREWVAAEKPYLGICLGYQILFDSSGESPGVDGLGIISGEVKRFAEKPGLKIPHMGWNAAAPKSPNLGHWSGLGEDPYFYYVHSYFPVPNDSSVVAAETTYGDDCFAAAVEMPNLLACQFHPEKSQDAGIRLIGNFLGL